jgi:acyl-CoA thioesterase-1
MRRAFFHFAFVFYALCLYSCSENSSNESGTTAGTTPTKRAQPDTVVKSQVLKTILFFGNSITAGYGVEPSEAFPAIIQKKLDSSHLAYKVINAGVSGETSSGGLARIDWILRQPPDVFVLELGGNDGLRGLPLAETRKNLQAIISRVRNKSPSTQIILAGMMIPPNMGAQYAREFQNIYPVLANQNQVSLIPFLLQGVGGEARLNQSDGIHPTPAGHRIVAENVWRVLKDILDAGVH